MATRTVDLGKVVGPPGPNSVSSTTATNLTGVLAGNGSTVEVKPVDAAPTANSGNLVASGGVAAKASSLAAGMAIIATGDTHMAIPKGQYVYIQDHATLAEGMYKATANIAADGTLSTSNVSMESDGGLNSLRKADTSGASKYAGSAKSVTFTIENYVSADIYMLEVYVRFSGGFYRGTIMVNTDGSTYYVGQGSGSGTISSVSNSAGTLTITLSVSFAYVFLLALNYEGRSVQIS